MTEFYVEKTVLRSYNGTSAVVTVPSGITEIGNEAFVGCECIEELIIPEGVKSIGTYAFKNCDKLKQVTFPQSLEVIGFEAFLGCSSLESVTFPENLKCISILAFSYSGLKWAYIPDSVRTIGDMAFMNSALEFISVPGNLAIGNSVCNQNCKVERRPAPDNESQVNIVKTEKGEFEIIGGTLVSYNGTDTEIVIPDGVTEITADSISCGFVEKITIPQGVTKIPSMRMFGFPQLEEVVLPDGVTEIERSAFSACKKLTKINFPSSLLKIGDRAFYDCFRLKDVELPETLTDIGEDTFGNTAFMQNNEEEDEGPTVELAVPYEILRYLSETLDIPEFNEISEDAEGFALLKLPEDVAAMIENEVGKEFRLTSIATHKGEFTVWNSILIKYSGKDKKLKVPDGITDICESAFEGVKLTSLYIPDSVTELHFHSLWMSEIKKLSVPGHLTVYKARPDRDCKIERRAAANGLPEVEIVKTEKGEYELLGTVITGYFGEDDELDIPYGITEIGEYAFEDTYLKSVVIPSGCKIGDYAFRNTLWDDAHLCSAYLTDGVTEVGKGAFANMWSLRYIGLPNSIEKIGEYALYNCNLLKEIILPQRLTEIPESLLEWDNEIEDIVIPYGVTKIGEKAFEECTELKSIVIPPTVTEIGENAFSGCSGLREVFIAKGFDTHLFANAIWDDVEIIEK